MIRRAYIIGTVAVGLVLSAIHTPAYCRLVSSAHSFQRNFQDLKGAGNSLSLPERLMFSLMLTKTAAPPPPGHEAAPSAVRASGQ